MRAYWAVALMAVCCVGCSNAITRISTHNPNYDEVWLGTLDVVSDHLHVERANKDRGLIVAGTDTRWIRTEVEIEILDEAGQYDVAGKAKDEKLQVMLRPSGLRTGENREVLRDNPEIVTKLLERIQERVGKGSKKKPPKPKDEPAGAEAQP